MNRKFLLFAVIAGGLAVIAGAMLTHQFKNNMPVPALDVYEVAVRYQFYHVFALLFTGLLSKRFPGIWIKWAGNCFIAGILLFSGSLYIISALMTKGIDIPTFLGILTPLGGLGFILGWLFLALAIRNEKDLKTGSGTI